MFGSDKVSSRETCEILQPHHRKSAWASLTSNGLAIVLFLLSIAVCACGNSDNSSSAAAPTDACATLPRATASNFAERLNRFLNNFCYQKQNWEHDAQVRSSDGVHLSVQIWYSPSLFNWMTVQNRQGPVPDGAILVKEEHLSLTSPLFLWSLMVKDSNLSWDGWYWGIIFPKKDNRNAALTQAANGVCPEPQALLNRSGALLPKLSRFGDSQSGHLREYRLPGRRGRRGNSPGSWNPIAGRLPARRVSAGQFSQRSGRSSRRLYRTGPEFHLRKR